MSTVKIEEEYQGVRCELFNDHFQNSKRYPIRKAQLIIADIPYNIGKNAYGSRIEWYIEGDNSKGESKLANSEFFDTDKDFRIPEFLHFCSKMLVPEPKETGKSPCMVVFCAFDQQFELIEEAKKHGLNRYINLVFVKNSSSQVLKANMRVVGNCEYGLILYRDKLPKFRNQGKMIFNAMQFDKDSTSEKIHPTQKPIALIERLISIFTDEGDVVIDPCCGSASTLVAAHNLGRHSFGFEIKKDFFNISTKRIEKARKQLSLFKLPQKRNNNAKSEELFSL